MICFAIGSADRFALLKDLCHLGIELYPFFLILFDFLMALLNSLIHPQLELFSKSSVQNVDQIGSAHFDHFFFTIRQTHANKGMLLDKLDKIV